MVVFYGEVLNRDGRIGSRDGTFQVGHEVDFRLSRYKLGAHLLGIYIDLDNGGYAGEGAESEKMGIFERRKDGRMVKGELEILALEARSVWCGGRGGRGESLILA